MAIKISDIPRKLYGAHDKAANGVMFQRGTTVPTDTTAGYGVGCLFQHTDGTTSTALYLNEGSVTSCDFNAIVSGAHSGSTLDAAFDLGAIINGAVSAATALQVGDASDKILMYGLSNHCYITTTGTANLYIQPDTGVIGITGVTQAATTANVANSMSRNYAGVGTAPVLTLTSTHATDVTETLKIDRNSSGAGSALVIDSEGTSDCVTVACLAAAASGVKVTTEAATGTALELVCAASTTVAMANVNGVTGNWVGAAGVGMLDLTCDGTLASTSASLLNIKFNGTSTSGGAGTLARFVDTSTSGGGTEYAVYISSTNSEALHVDSGGVVIDESVTIGTTLGVTGACSFDSDVTVTGTLTAGILGQDGFAASTLNAALTLDGDGTGKVTINGTGSGNIELQRNVTMPASRSLTVAGVDGSDMIILTAGDASIANGSLTVVDTDAATSFALTNNTMTTQTLSTITSTSITSGIGLSMTFAALSTGKGLVMTADALTTGDMVYLDSSEAGMGAGFFINCNDSDTSKFSVAKYGATVIAGTAANTAALTLTAGDAVVTNGKVTAATTANATHAFSRNYAGAGTAACVTITSTHASDTKETLFIDRNSNAAGSAVIVDSEGTSDLMVLQGLSAAASIIKATAEATTGTVLEAICAANTTTNVASIIGDFIGAANKAMLVVQATGSGTLADADASVVSILSDNTPANSPTSGVLLDILDTAGEAGAGTGYAVMIRSTSNEALHVNSGLSLFDERASFEGGVTLSDSDTATLIIGDSTGFIMGYTGTVCSLDAGAANETFSIGATTDTDVKITGATASADFLWDASEDELYLGNGVNLKIGATTDRNTTESTNGIYLFDGTAPVDTLANGITLYSAAGELKVMDAGGVATTLSPHTKLDGSSGGEFWTFHSTNSTTGKVVHIEMEQFVKAVCEKLGMDFVDEYVV